MVQYNPLQCLPTSAELPDSDDTPVDNELQNLIPNLLEAILALAWSDRIDWFFGMTKMAKDYPLQKRRHSGNRHGLSVWLPDYGRWE